MSHPESDLTGPGAGRTFDSPDDVFERLHAALPRSMTLLVDTHRERRIGVAEKLHRAPRRRLSEFDSTTRACRVIGKVCGQCGFWFESLPRVKR